MVKIQIDLPLDLSEELRTYSIENKIFDKRIATIHIFRKFFKENKKKKSWFGK